MKSAFVIACAAAISMAAAPPPVKDRNVRNLRDQIAIADKAGFSGEIGIAHFNSPISKSSDKPLQVTFTQHGSNKDGKVGRLWRWASVTKQVIAVLVMQEVVAGKIDLDRSVATYLPGFRSPNAGAMTVRQLLRHQSGLPNPDDTPKLRDDLPSFYTAEYDGNRDPLTGYCAGPIKALPGEAWSYNNCDYMVAGALLEAVTGKTWQALVAQRLGDGLLAGGRIVTTPPAHEDWPGHVDGKPEPPIDIASYGAAGSLYGTVNQLLGFDARLAGGQILPLEALRELWDGKPELGFMALGQWSFRALLKGCDKPVRIVERRGTIGGTQVRNLILPEQLVAVVLFADQAEFEFGEIWQGKGFSHDMLSFAGCGPTRND